MARPSLSVAVLLLAACARPTAAPAPLADLESRCLDLRDHIVSLYADDYLATNNEFLRETQRVAFVDAWARELAKRGTFDRFQASCEAGLTRARFECGISATTSEGLIACMRLEK